MPYSAFHNIHWSPEYTERCFAFIQLFFPIISALLLPLYICMNRKNRSRDEKNPDFPVTNFIFEITAATLSVMITLTITTGALYWVLPLFSVQYATLNDVFRALSVVYHLIRENVTLTFNFLLPLLAILKFFFPRIGEFISSYRRVSNVLMIMLLLTSFIMTSFFQIFLFVADLEKQKVLETSVQNFLFYMPICMVPSMLLYLFVVESHRNKAKTYPERYLENQILVFILTKGLFFPLLKEFKRRGMTVRELWEVDAMIYPDLFQELLNESHVTLLLIQLTYIFSYRKDLKAWCRDKRPFDDIGETEDTVDQIATTTV